MFVNSTPDIRHSSIELHQAATGSIAVRRFFLEWVFDLLI
jgi:hypothetical protein